MDIPTLAFLGAVHEVSHTSPISVFRVCVFVGLCVCLRLMIGRILTSKLSTTTKQLLLNSFLQEAQVRAFIVPHLFHES